MILQELVRFYERQRNLQDSDIEQAQIVKGR